MLMNDSIPRNRHERLASAHNSIAYVRRAAYEQTGPRRTRIQRHLSLDETLPFMQQCLIEMGKSLPPDRIRPQLCVQSIFHNLPLRAAPPS